MAKFVSRVNPVSVSSLKRKSLGTVVVHHWTHGEVRFTRVHGGWLCERTDVTSESPVVVSSADVANECNRAVGCAESWARVY